MMIKVVLQNFCGHNHKLHLDHGLGILTLFLNSDSKVTKIGRARKVGYL